MHTSIKRFLFIAAGFAALLKTHSVKAQDQLLQVTVTTTPLITDSPDAPFWLDFLWINGSTTANVNNPVTLSNFNFGAGGSATAGTVYTSGTDVTGNLGSTVQIGDIVSGSASFTNEFAEQFTPGDTLTFQMLVPKVGQPGTGGAESLAVSILSGTGASDFADADANPLYTTAPDGGSLVDVSVPAIDAPTGTFGWSSYQTTTGSPAGVVATAVPEPRTYATLGMGMIALLAFWRKARRARA
jgi:hypothetical protein